MKKTLINILGLIGLFVCSTGFSAPLMPNSKLPDNKAILIGKISLSANLDKNGKITTQSDHGILPVFISFASSNTTGDDNLYFNRVKINDYFAIIVDANSELVLDEMQFVISHQERGADTENKYHTMLTKTQFPFKIKLIAGEIYSMGTINIDLADIAFIDKGIGGYDGTTVQYIIPKNIRLDNDSIGGKAWFSTEFPNVNKIIRDAQAQSRITTIENKFQKM